MLTAALGCVRSLVFTASVGVKDKGPLENRLKDARNRVMDHAITIWCSTDQSFLGLVDLEGVVRTRAVGLRGQFAVQRPRSRSNSKSATTGLNRFPRRAFSDARSK